MARSLRSVAGMFCVFASFAILQPALGQNVNFWTDNGGTEDWFAGNNWSQGSPPDDDEFVIFNEGFYDVTIEIGANEARMDKLRVWYSPSFPGATTSESDITLQGNNTNDSSLVALTGIELFGEPERQFLEFENLSIFAGSNTSVRIFNIEASDKSRLDFLLSGAYAARGFLIEGPGAGELNFWGSVFRSDPTFTSEIASTGRLQASNSTIDTPIDNDGQWDVYDDTIFQGRKLTGSGTIKLHKAFEFLTFDPSGDELVNVTNSISGPGGVKIASGTVELTASSSFTGGLLLDGGILKGSSGPRLGGLSNYLQFSGGTLQATSSFTIAIRSFVVEGGIDTNGNNITVTGDFTGPTDGVFTKSGDGTVTLNNNGSGYTGSYLVTGGILTSGAGDTFSDRSKVMVENGATLHFEGNENFDAINGDGAINVNGKTVRLGYFESISNDFAGQLVGDGIIEKRGSGSQRFSGDTSGFSGSFVLHDGVLAFAAGESLDQNLHIPASANLIFDPPSGSTTYAHSISGSGLWFKEGDGTLNLTGDSLGYSGLLSVGAGRLNVNSQIGAQWVIVTGAGTLGGTGNISSLVFAEKNSTISPGASIGKLNADTLQMFEGATLEIELAGSGGVPGVDFDQFAVIGAAEIDDAVLSVRLAEGFTPMHGGEFQVLDIGGAITGSGFTTFDLQEVPGMAWDTSNFATGGTISLSVTLPGDYNLDGIVNAADYTVWRDNLGQPAGTIPSDIDGGIIGAAQYANWVTSFGESLQATSNAETIPEPVSQVSVVALLGVLTVSRRIHCSRIMRPN